jgi:D-alanyl-D-alanine dipeptidase
MIKKINGLLKILIVAVTINFFTVTIIAAQPGEENPYGLFVVKDIKYLKTEIAADSDKGMVDLKKRIPSLVIDVRYSSVNNFMHRRLYPKLNTTYLRLTVANSLEKVVAELKAKNLTLKIFDAYRPYSVTEKMWASVKDSRYAADPSKGSGHNRGIAVDLTLVDLTSRKELPMGTGFDNFSDSAHQNFTALPGPVIANRQLLKSVMEKYGFVNLETEWWHFSLPNAGDYEILDIPFEELNKLNRK